MPCSSVSTFAWIGALLINAAFVVLISWAGAATHWTLGCATCALYTFFLFALAHYLERRTMRQHPSPTSLVQYGTVTSNEEVSPPISSTTSNDGIAVNANGNDRRTTNMDGGNFNSSNDNDPMEPLLLLSPQAADDARGIATIQSLLYGLGVVALGVTGAFLALHIVGCHYDDDNDSSYYYSGKWRIPSNASSWMSRDVYAWAASDGQNKYQRDRSICYLPHTGTTLFTAHGGIDQWDMTEILYSVRVDAGGNNTVVTAHPQFGYPRWLSVVDNGTTCCFSTSNRDHSVACFKDEWITGDNPQSAFRYPAYTSQWSNVQGNNVHSMVVPSSSSSSPQSTTNAILYYKLFPTDRRQEGQMVFALHRSTATNSSVLLPVTLLSEYVDKNHNHGDDDGGSSSSSSSSCSTQQNIRQQALGILFLTAFPMLTTSLYLWKVKQQVSSMGCLAYGSLTVVFVAIHTAVHPDGSIFDDWFTRRLAYQYWFLVSGLTCFLLSVGAILLYGGGGIPPTGGDDNTTANASIHPNQGHSTSEQQREETEVGMVEGGTGRGHFSPSTESDATGQRQGRPRPRLIFPGPFHWCASAACLGYMAGLMMTLQFWDKTGADSFRFWFLLTTLGAIPLSVFGTAIDNLFVLLVSACVYLVDAFRFNDWMSSRLASKYDDDLRVPVIFVGLAICGLGLGVIGMLLSQRRNQIQSIVTMCFVWLVESPPWMIWYQNLFDHRFYCCSFDESEGNSSATQGGDDLVRGRNTSQEGNNRNDDNDDDEGFCMELDEEANQTLSAAKKTTAVESIGATEAAELEIIEET